MAQDDLIHPVDDRDRELARDAQERIHTKASLASEVLLDQIVRHSTDVETPFEDKIKAFNELNKITAAGERAKRQLAAEGLTGETGPIFQIVLANGEVFASELSSEEPETGDATDQTE